MEKGHRDHRGEATRVTGDRHPNDPIRQTTQVGKSSFKWMLDADFGGYGYHNNFGRGFYRAFVTEKNKSRKSSNSFKILLDF